MHRQHQQQPGLACRAYFSECVWYPFGRHHSSTYQRCLDGGSWRVVVECLALLKIDEPLDFSLASFTWLGLTLWSDVNLCLASNVSLVILALANEIGQLSCRVTDWSNGPFAKGLPNLFFPFGVYMVYLPIWPNWTCLENNAAECAFEACTTCRLLLHEHTKRKWCCGHHHVK